MSFPMWFRRLWWVAAMGACIWFLRIRWNQVMVGTPSAADLLVIAVLAALALVPVFSEVTLLGMKFGQAIKESTREIKEHISDIRLDIRNANSLVQSNTFMVPTSAERQKERLDLEVEQAHGHSVRPLSRNEVRLTVSLAEDLAIRALEQELGSSISREVAVRAGEGWLNLDGAAARGNELVAIEVKYVQENRLAIFQLEYLLDLITKQTFQDFQRVSLILVLVTDEPDLSPELRQRLSAVFARYSILVTLRTYFLTELKKRFGIVE